MQDVMDFVLNSRRSFALFMLWGAGYLACSAWFLFKHQKRSTAAGFFCMIWPLWVPVWVPIWLITWPVRALLRRRRVRRKVKEQLKHFQDMLVPIMRTWYGPGLSRLAFGNAFAAFGGAGAIISGLGLNQAGVTELNRRVYDTHKLARGFQQGDVVKGEFTDHNVGGQLLGSMIDCLEKLHTPEQPPYKPPAKPYLGTHHSYAALVELFEAVEDVSYPDALLHQPIHDGPEMNRVNEALKCLYQERLTMKDKEKDDDDPQQQHAKIDVS